MGKPDWNKMYLVLVDSVERALEALPKSAETELSRQYLLKGLLEAEERYILSTETDEEALLGESC